MNHVFLFKIYLPYENEQRRIVAGVDHLMPLCDKLEAALLRPQADRGRLIEAVVERMLAGDKEENSFGYNNNDIIIKNYQINISCYICRDHIVGISKDNAVNSMEEIIVDDTYKIHFSKKLVDLLEIRPRDRFNIIIKDDKIVLEKVKREKEVRKDSLIELLESPVHVDPAKIKQLNLKSLEEELWAT